MRRMLTKICLVLGMVFCMQGAALSAPLMYDDFNGLDIDHGNWYYTIWHIGVENYIYQFDLGGGDKCLKMQGDAFMDWSKSSIGGNRGFSRGLHKRCTFKVWHDSGLSDADIGGPWYNYEVSYAISNGCAQILTSNKESPVFGGPPFLFNQDPNTQWGSGPETSLFNAAWPNAVSKATAILVRVWLDDNVGARMEFSTDDGANWTEELDTTDETGDGTGKGNRKQK